MGRGAAAVTLEQEGVIDALSLSLSLARPMDSFIISGEVCCVSSDRDAGRHMVQQISTYRSSVG